MLKIGITERGDAALQRDWISWVGKGNPAILITKNPLRLSYLLNSVSNKNIIVHCTITGMGGSAYEPNVPVVSKAIEGLIELEKTVGIERLVLRVDPIIPTEEGFVTAKNVINTVGKPNLRIRISFLDNYPHVKERFIQAGLPPLNYNFHAPLETRIKMWEDLGKPEICGEPEMPCTGCVSKKDLEILNIENDTTTKSQQRMACACLALKHELLNNKTPCKHTCAYCYWQD
jgi:hypothetical protein